MDQATTNRVGDRVVNTGRVLIGSCAFRERPMDFPCSAPAPDMLRLQSAFAGPGKRFATGVDWDGILIVAGCGLGIAAALVWFWAH